MTKFTDYLVKEFANEIKISFISRYGLNLLTLALNSYKTSFIINPECDL